MSSYPVVLFSLLLISSIVAISSFESSFADEVIATSSGFENSSILELKNSRGNTANIDTVRIWLSQDNEFKSFKTENGWIGKNTPQGVIVFTSQKQVLPGEGVKFGIKTSSQNPIINWKALDSNGEIIASATVTTLESQTEQNENELNQSKITGVKDESIFRFIPDKPTSNSYFRIVGEEFVPNQDFDFYIGDKLIESINSDADGKILFTAKTPESTNDERTEFTLVDSGGNEKSVSIRIPQIENREIAEEIKLSFGNTPKQVKRGETITLNGMATPNITLTITSNDSNADIVNIATIDTAFDGKWSYEHLFSPELELGTFSIEISDGKSQALRNFEIISAKIININSIETKYNPGDIVQFEGIAIPNKNMSVILEDSIGTEIFSRNILVGDTGNVSFEIDIPRGSIEGTYVLLSFQGNEEGVTIFGIGQEPEPILILRPSKLNFAAGENPKITIQGPTNAQIGIIVIDSADREKFSDTINLGPDGKEVYEITNEDMGTGSFTINAKRGESSGSALFTIGLKSGSGAISIQTTRDTYQAGEQILILGNTGSVNVLLDITITDPNGNTIKKIETFSDRFGVFKMDNFRIPSDAESGKWIVNAKSGGNFKGTEFYVEGDELGLTIKLEKDAFRTNELMSISGEGARMSSTIAIKIMNSEDELIQKLSITAKSDGGFATLWQIPADLETGYYKIKIDDGKNNTELGFIINE